MRRLRVAPGVASSKISTVWVERTSGISWSRVSTTSRSDTASLARTRSRMSCSPETSATWLTSVMLSSCLRTDFQDRWSMSR